MPTAPVQPRRLFRVRLPLAAGNARVSQHLATRSVDQHVDQCRIRCVVMSLEASSLAAAVSGLVRSDPHSPGITRVRGREGFRYRDPSGAEITQGETMDRVRALRI